MSDARPLPLAGIRVADFCWLIAGPATSRILADLGAEVIKIESHARLDNIRLVGVQPGDPGSIDTNGVFQDTNTSKRSVTIDLNTPRGIELARELVRHSDVVMNNFSGDRMDRWGLGYDALREVRPDIIAMAMPVMGTTGPYVRYGSYGNGVIGYAGLRTNMGFPGRPPIGIGPLYSDFSVPYFGVAALMAALYHRERTGEGQFIDMAQMESSVSLLGTGVIEYTANGHIPEPPGNRSRDYAPHGAYQCAGNDRWCVVAVRTDEEWRTLADAIGEPALAADPRFATFEARKANEDALDAALSAWTRERDPWEVTHLLQARGVMAGVVEDLEDMLVRDEGLSRLHFERLQREDGDPVFTTHRQPFWFDGESPPLRVHPRMGADNEAVMKGILGLSEEDYVELIASEVLH
jgi:benzylsuccinate CoA-transferase BbsF subunit